MAKLVQRVESTHRKEEHQVLGNRSQGTANDPDDARSVVPVAAQNEGDSIMTQDRYSMIDQICNLAGITSLDFLILPDDSDHFLSDVLDQQIWSNILGEGTKTKEQEKKKADCSHTLPLSIGLQVLQANQQS